ncbi:MAG: DUF4920 domain-containing protein [Acidobacteria bacterium]|nr:DUF4920 domain-containing protein [Acidobacteriota bacterium]
MRKAAMAVVMMVGVMAAVTVAAQQTQEKKFGSALTLTEVTKVSDIYANPEKFNGKRVQVQGPIVDVCADMGCWLALGSDKESETIRFKVEDGVIVFPMSVKGMNAKVEGVIAVDTTTVDGKTTTKIQIKGEGAVVF